MCLAGRNYLRIIFQYELELAFTLLCPILFFTLSCVGSGSASNAAYMGSNTASIAAAFNFGSTIANGFSQRKRTRRSGGGGGGSKSTFSIPSVSVHVERRLQGGALPHTPSSISCNTTCMYPLFNICAIFFFP